MPQFPINESKNKRIIISVGGSMIFPDDISAKFIKDLREFVINQVSRGWKFILITGGGKITRVYQEGARKILGLMASEDDIDWLGVHTTRVNAHLIRTVFSDIAQPVIVTNPEEDDIDLKKSVVVAGGWKPGWSTDFVAAKIAERVKAPYVVNLTDVKQIYNADPKKNKNAKPIEEMLWKDYREMVGSKWTPGMNLPFDPIAAKLCEKNNTTVLIMQGNDLNNLKKAMEKGEFFGSLLKN
jgi:uridylate kinase